MNDDIDPIAQENILWEDLQFLIKNKTVKVEVTYDQGAALITGFLKALNNEFARFQVLEDSKVRTVLIRLDCIDVLDYEIDDN